MSLDFNLWGKPAEDTIDFEKINRIALNSMEMIFSNWLPGGRVLGCEYICSDKNGGKGDSCSTNINSGVGSDFSSGERWGDPVAMVACIEGIAMKDAALKLQEFLSIGINTPTPPPIPKQSEEEKVEYAKRVSASLWMEGEECPVTHPYLLKKGVIPDGVIRYHPPTGNILIPLRDGNDILGVQRVSADGDKKVNSGGKLSGCCHVISGEPDTVYICEGYATAMSVHMATGKTAVMAVSAGNLFPVGEKIAKLYPSSHIIFAADNDQDKDPNPGVKAANDAVKRIGRGTVITPPFPVGVKGDWNDYAVTHGAAATRTLLLFKRDDPLFIDVNSMMNVEAEFLIDEVMETPCTGMVFGASGSGKSFFVIDLALHIASDLDWLGKPTKHGPVFYICGEGRHGIPRRVKAWEHHHGRKVPDGRFMISNIRMSFDPESVTEMVRFIDNLAENIGRPTLVIVDTMARALPGNADENSAKDTNLFFNECDNLQSRYGCSVLVVHHSGHSDAKRARGSSAIKGVLDVEIMLCNNVIEWTKTKDMEPHAPLKYNLDKVMFGDGKRDNSCVITYDLTARIEKKDTAYRAAAKSSLIDTVKAEGLGGERCTVNGWKDAFSAKYSVLSTSAQQKYFKRELKGMENDGFVLVDGSFVVITNHQLKQDICNSLMFGDNFNNGQNGKQ